jgi:hypothetical protein
MGERACGADAAMFAMVAGILTPFFETKLRDTALGHQNLVAYSERMMQCYYPQFAKKAA